MAPLRRLLTCGLASALATQCAGDSCETENYDQTALLQSHLSRKSDLALSQHSAQSAAFFPKLASLNDPHTRKSALLEIEKTAVKLANMDRTEATDVVIEVCTETAEMLNNTVLYAIIEEHTADVASLEAAYGRFDQWEVLRQGFEDDIRNAEALVAEKAEAMQNCTVLESETCVNETICTMEENEHCQNVTWIEENLTRIDDLIHTRWCEEGTTPEIRSQYEWRNSTVTLFEEYTRLMTALERAQALCDQHTEHCETTLSKYMDQATECDSLQQSLETASCDFHHTAYGHLAAYQQGYRTELAFYNDVKARVMIGEADRKVEWDVLTRVVCLLLTLTNEEDGVASNDATEARIQRCWDDEVDVSHLDIDYKEPPPELTLPELPPYPCTAEHEDHYETGVPAACEALEELHRSDHTSTCSCTAEVLPDQRLTLGHYLLIDPAIVLTVTGEEWSLDMEGTTYSGSISRIHHLDDATRQYFSDQMLTDDQMEQFEDDTTTPNDDYTGPITDIAWAYPDPDAHFTSCHLGQRFAQSGGMIFLGNGGQVIEARELAASSGKLGQPVVNTLSFSSAEEITAEQASSACGGLSGTSMHEVAETSNQHDSGARKYCWVMGGDALSQCANGCFVYELAVAGGNEYALFRVIEGMHVRSTEGEIAQ